MKLWFGLPFAALFFGLMTAGGALAADARLGAMRVLPGYEHQQLQGFDSIVGKVSKKDGLQISYEIGSIPKPGAPRFGGQFSDYPKTTPKDQARWYLEQTVNGQPVHLAHRKDDVLLVSFPQKGMNFSVTVRSTAEVAEALLMILTYPEPLAADAKQEAKKK